jgi:peptidoglycan/xylan/chitin deacetylase (PgdA/CDA1 family)
MRFFRPWIIVRWLYSDALFRIKTRNRVYCLTYDDGPNPESTPGLLDLLDRHKVKALFFCDGKSAENNPDLMDEIRRRGHLTGNHGYEHRDGWKTHSGKYFDDIRSASELTSGRYFRPPYGRMTFKQYRHLRKSFRIILWDIMPYDFDRCLDPGKSLEILKNKLRPGSVIVLHDVPGPSLEITREFLEYAVSAGYTFVLPE